MADELGSDLLRHLPIEQFETCLGHPVAIEYRS